MKNWVGIMKIRIGENENKGRVNEINKYKCIELGK